jgi:tetratricopeptide (TPR) repeat protein
MNRSIALALIVFLLQAVPLFAAECSVATYDALVTEGKKGDEAREWGKSVEAYSRILAECRSQVKDVDLVKVYDALGVAQLMLENYTGAIESAKKCIELDSRYNACMMTAAKSYESLGDRRMALEFARAAADTEAHDDYSSAVAIYAKDFLRRMKPL